MSIMQRDMERQALIDSGAFDWDDDDDECVMTAEDWADVDAEIEKLKAQGLIR